MHLVELPDAAPRPSEAHYSFNNNPLWLSR